MAPLPDLIDLRVKGVLGAIGAYLVQTADGPGVIDCGPSSSLETLRRELADRGLAVGDLRHLLLTHIHFDHAGAAGVLARENQRLEVHVSEVGAPHLADTSRLEASARRLYGDAFDDLWGEVAPVPAERLHAIGEEVVGFRSFPTPGHASHHVSFLDEAGTLFAGDVAGIRITPSRFIVAPTPPPDVDLEAWEESLIEIERRAPNRLAVTHFGIFEDVEEHLATLRLALRESSERVVHGMDVDTFVTALTDDIHTAAPDLLNQYITGVSLRDCFGGLERYWRKRRERLAAEAFRHADT